MAEASDEADLLAAARRGDGHAFGLLVGPHRQRLWSVCYRVTNNRVDAEDALQDALFAAWHHLHSFRGDSSIGTWLYRVASNAAVAVAKRRGRDRPTEVDAAEVLPDFGQRVVDVDVVRRGLAEVPAAYRSALVLRELCDFSYEQIAEHQGVGVQTVKSRISRGRQALRAAISEAG